MLSNACRHPKMTSDFRLFFQSTVKHYCCCCFQPTKKSIGNSSWDFSHDHAAETRVLWIRGVRPLQLAPLSGRFRKSKPWPKSHFVLGQNLEIQFFWSYFSKFQKNSYQWPIRGQKNTAFTTKKSIFGAKMAE